jgi:hypothetical protein
MGAARWSSVILNEKGKKSKILRSDVTRNIHQRNLHCSLRAVSEDFQKKKIVFLGTPEVAASSLRRIFQRSKDPGSLLQHHHVDKPTPISLPLPAPPRPAPLRACATDCIPTASDFEVVAVVSNPPAPSGRKMVLTVRARSRCSGFPPSPPTCPTRAWRACACP